MVKWVFDTRPNGFVIELFSPILKPIFGANHRWAMARGEESLKIELARRHGEPHGEPPKATFR